MKRKGEGGIARQPTGMCLVVDMSVIEKEKGERRDYWTTHRHMPGDG